MLFAGQIHHYPESWCGLVLFILQRCKTCHSHCDKIQPSFAIANGCNKAGLN